MRRIVIEGTEIGGIVEADDPPAIPLSRVTAKLTTATGCVDPVKEEEDSVAGDRHGAIVLKFENTTSRLRDTNIAPAERAGQLAAVIRRRGGL